MTLHKPFVGGPAEDEDEHRRQIGVWWERYGEREVAHLEEIASAAAEFFEGVTGWEGPGTAAYRRMKRALRRWENDEDCERCNSRRP